MEKCTAICERAHAQYGVLPLTSLSSLTTGITFSALAHMEAGEIG